MGRHGPTEAEASFIHQQVVADQQGVFHGAGWDAEGLHHEGDDEHRNGQRQKGKLHVRHHLPRGTFALGRGDRGRSWVRASIHCRTMR